MQQRLALSAGWSTLGSQKRARFGQLSTKAAGSPWILSRRISPVVWHPAVRKRHFCLVSGHVPGEGDRQNALLVHVRNGHAGERDLGDLEPGEVQRQRRIGLIDRHENAYPASKPVGAKPKTNLHFVVQHVHARSVRAGRRRDTCWDGGGS